MDDFFKLGGNSISAIQAAYKIGLATDINIVANIIFKKRKIYDLAVYLNTDHLKINRLITPLNTINHAKSNLFLLPAGFGGSEIYIHLAKKLEERHNVYGLEPYNWIEKENIIKDVKVMAERYIEIIITIQPSGPYLVGGHCSGGIMAFEIACQLKKKYNHDVSNVILIDATILTEEQKYYNIKLADYYKSYERNKRNIQAENSEEALKLDELFFLEPNFIDYTAEFYPGIITLYRAIYFPQFPFAPNTQQEIEYLDKLEKLHAKDNTFGFGAYVKNLKVRDIDASHFTVMNDTNIDIIAKHILSEV